MHSPSRKAEVAGFAQAIGHVACELLGEPTKTTPAELRFGTHGSMSVSLDKGTWYDFESGTGGGVLDLLQQRAGLDKADALAWLRERGLLIAAEPRSGGGKRVIAAYDYRSEDGVLLFQTLRFDPKSFKQRRPGRRGDWEWNLKGVRRVIYRLPEVLAAVSANRTVYIAEGEKGVHHVESLGFTATCCPGGAGKWRDEYNAVFAGADVVVFPDNDPQAVDKNDGTPRWHPDGRPVLPGQDHAADVARRLSTVAKRVRVVMLPDLPIKGDVANWVSAGGTAEALAAIVAQAEPWPGAVEDEPPLGKIGYPGDHAAIANADGPDPVSAIVAEFNTRYMVVNEAGKAVVYEPAHDIALNRRHYERITFDDLKRLYLNRRVCVGNGTHGEPIYSGAADIWLRHPGRRQYIGGVIFDPSGNKAPSDALNLWQGFAVSPRRGSWTRLQGHIRNVVCSGNAEHCDWLMGWMARLVQRPGEQGEVAVVMKGIEGAGKGTLAKALLHIVGQHGLAISNAKHLTGNFNGHLRDTVLLFADEAFFAGDRAHVGVLKALITEPTLTIEAKFQNAVQMPNFVHLMMASNEDWVVPASLEARRFFVLEVSAAKANDHAYFAALWAEMENGGYAAMLHDLLAHDLTFFNHRRAPATAGLQTQKKLSLAIPESWWLEVLHRGYVFKSRLGLEDHFHRWHEQVATDLLFDAYETYAKLHGDRHPMGRETFGRFMGRMEAKAIRPGKAVIGERIADVDNIHGGTSRKAELVQLGRAHAYSLGSLVDARGAFQRVTSLEIDWPDENAPET